MADDKLAELLKTQKSLTEWLEDIKHADVVAIRKEDNDKRERLKVLNSIIYLPYDKPTQFEASAMTKSNKTFAKFLKDRGEELCALRLMPKEDNLPKLRMRGKTITGAYAWFREQSLDPSKYRADFVPHSEESIWATIFIVNKNGIQGEIISGGHHQLTQGFHDNEAPIVFRFDFENWSIYPENKKALAHLKKLVEYIYVPGSKDQKQLKAKLNSTFINNYLTGYFETTESVQGTWYIDYSTMLGKMYEDMIIRLPSESNDSVIRGQTGSPGFAKGKVKIVLKEDILKPFSEGSILVCEVTTPEYVPLMQKAAAIVANQGGILSHAAIVARELKIPCIVATGDATNRLKNGQKVSVDADLGIVTIN